MSKTLIIGATSAIAQEAAKLFAARGDALVLVARDEKKLQAVVQDLEVRGAASVDHTIVDLTDTRQHDTLIAKAYDIMGGLDIVLIAHGVLPNQEECEKDYREAARTMVTNFTSVVSLLTPIANRLEKQGHGTIAVISSVAGDRGRQSNYVYGASKAGKTAFLSGLRNRLQKSGVNVITIKPGFVDTPMTAHIEKKGLLWVKPEQIAKGIVKAIDRKKDVVYLPGFWRCIMMIVRHIPEGVFKKLSM